ncbi:nickel/cobalt transporter [Streptomyces sp. NPDC048330]|uniref:nickel/cobalt transporter n=1 Tax=Streptomyces sp. NPDC048330 TaxID=3365533 RepID=UPI00371F5993
MTPAHRTLTAAAGLLITACCLTTPAAAAPAHPLGNFTVNYHTGLVLHPDHIDATVIVDRAEIAALQERPRIDTDGDNTLTAAETTRYATARCTALAGQLDLRTPAGPARWSPRAAQLTWEAGEAGLKTSRLTCAYTTAAPLERGGDVSVRTAYDTTRIGWREITAKGAGLAITGTDLPATSPTDQLRRYPPDPLATPLDQRTAELRTTPSADPPATSVLPGPPVVGQTVDRVAAWFDSLVARRELTVPVGLLALLLALVLGASHALLPGHGKTIMAAHLAGRRGTRRDAVTVGATVTLTHTAGVLVLGLALPAATHLAGETVLAWLGTISGLIVTAIGLWLLTRALRNDPDHQHHHHGHHTHHHHHGPGHHNHNHDHDHDHERDHHPGPAPSAGPVPAARTGPPEAASGNTRTRTLTAPAPASVQGDPHHHASSGRTQARSPGARRGLIGMGIAGGLVPSPSALVVLLGAVALGRTAFGVLLVLAYGLGMAATLTLAGLLLLHVKDRIRTLGDSHPRARRLVDTAARVGPTATSCLVVLVGIGLTARALAA